MTTTPAVAHGRLLVRGDPGYEHPRIGGSFNHRVPVRYPAAVLRASTRSDVVGGVRLAADRGWRVAVRSGGHSWAHWPLRDNALLIDLGDLGELGFDAATGTATAGPAVRGGAELAPFLERHGRFFSLGHCADVGLGGFLPQGTWRTPVGRAWSRPGVPRCGHPIPPENLCHAEAASNHLRPARGPGGAGAALGYDSAT